MKRDSKLIMILADVSVGKLSFPDAVPKINSLYEQQPVSEFNNNTHYECGACHGIVRKSQLCPCFKSKIQQQPSEGEIKYGIDIDKNPPNVEYTLWIEIEHERFKALPSFNDKKYAEKRLSAIKELLNR